MATCQGSAELSIEDLPPLPSPVRKVQRRQEGLGCALVLGITAFLVGATHGISSIEDLSPTFVWTCRGCIYTEALLALSCLIGLMLADPGVIQRTPETCSPIPVQVQELLLRGEEAVENVTDGPRTFCVRCLVWRPEKPAGFHPWYKLGLQMKPHHCRICQRCVVHFDHHCGVFGRCIGAGNIGFFYGLICLGSMGALTCTLTTILALSLTWDLVREKPEIYVTLSVLLGLYCCRRPLRYLVDAMIHCCAMLWKAPSAQSDGSVPPTA